MQVKDIILAVVWLGIIVASVGACYKVYVMDRSYTVLSLVECDPSVESCFSLLCDKASEDYNEDLCRQIESGEKRYFSFIRKQAKNIASCDARLMECPSLVCEEGEAGCEVITCVDQTLVAYGDESMSCTPEVIVPAPDQTTESIEMPASNDVAPSGWGGETLTPAAPVESTLPVPSPADTQEEGIPTPVTTPSEPTPAEEDLPEPTHNLPI